MSASALPLATPPHELTYGDVRLCFSQVVEGDAARDLVPYYHFRIITLDGQDAGHINFRVGDSEHIRLFAGHLGFVINEPLRGRGLAGQACLGLAPFVRTIYQSVFITCDPENLASKRTIEKLGARFLDEIAVPPLISHCAGVRIKRRYEWRVPRQCD